MSVQGMIDELVATTGRTEEEVIKTIIDNFSILGTTDRIVYNRETGRYHYTEAHERLKLGIPKEN